jgi:hypothetical protein
MLQTILWASFSLNTTTPWHIIVRHYHMLFLSTLLTTKKYTPLCNLVVGGDITFLGRRQSSTLITSHYSSCRPKVNSIMTAIRSGQHTYNSSTSTSSIKQEVTTNCWLHHPSSSLGTHHGARLFQPQDLQMAPPLRDRP